MLGGGFYQDWTRLGKFEAHTDQTYEPRLRLERRINVILYLNRDWSASYGGDLELWDADRRFVWSLMSDYVPCLAGRFDSQIYFVMLRCGTLLTPLAAVNPS